MHHFQSFLPRVTVQNCTNPASLCAKYFGLFASSYWSYVLNSLKILTLSAQQSPSDSLVIGQKRQGNKKKSDNKKRLAEKKEDNRRDWVARLEEQRVRLVIITHHVYENTYYRSNAPPFVMKKVKSEFHGDFFLFALKIMNSLNEMFVMLMVSGSWSATKEKRKLSGTSRLTPCQIHANIFCCFISCFEVKKNMMGSFIGCVLQEAIC